MTERVSVDAEVVELRVLEGRRIQVKTAEDLDAIARKIGKPILDELVGGHACPRGLRCAMNGKHLVAAYDGPCVFEIQAEGSTREGRAQ